jgi:hypothetical protein
MNPIDENILIRTLFAEFIFQKIINSSQNIQYFVQQYGKELSTQELFTFLRRVLFFEYFVCNNVHPLSCPFFDWNNELTFESLC